MTKYLKRGMIVYLRFKYKSRDWRDNSKFEIIVLWMICRGETRRRFNY